MPIYSLHITKMVQTLGPLIPITVHSSLPFAYTFLLNVRFWPPKCPFKTLFDAKFKHIINHIKIFLWPDPHSNALPYHS